MICECGCGQLAPIAKLTNSKRGNVKGQPVRFIFGHSSRVKSLSGENNPRWNGGKYKTDGGYVMVLSHEHPGANHMGYVREHILIAGEALGRPIPEKSPVHHVNGKRDDNRNENLVICEDSAYHFLLHQRQRAVAAGVPAHWLKCWVCKIYDDPCRMDTPETQTPAHPHCKKNKRRQAADMLAAVYAESGRATSSELIVCQFCKQPDKPSAMWIDRTGQKHFHRACRNARRRS